MSTENKESNQSVVSTLPKEFQAVIEKDIYESERRAKALKLAYESGLLDTSPSETAKEIYEAAVKEKELNKGS